MRRGVSWELTGNEAVVRVAGDGEATEPGERWGLMREPRSADASDAARFDAELSDGDWFGRS